MSDQQNIERLAIQFEKLLAELEKEKKIVKESSDRLFELDRRSRLLAVSISSARDSVGETSHTSKAEEHIDSDRTPEVDEDEELFPPAVTNPAEPGTEDRHPDADVEDRDPSYSRPKALPGISPERPDDRKSTKPSPSLKESLESKIGSYWFSRLGAAILLVAVILFAKEIHTRITPVMRVGLGYTASLALCAAGIATRKRYPKFAAPIISAGVLVSFFISFAGHFIPPTYCMSLGLSTTLMLASMFLVVGLAGIFRSESFGVLSILMGFWTAGFAITLTRAFTPIMLLFIAVLAILLEVSLRWKKPLTLAVIGCYAGELLWAVYGASAYYPTMNQLFRSEFAFATAYFAVFMIGDLISRTMHEKISAHNGDHGKQIVNNVGTAIVRYFNPVAYFTAASLIFLWTDVYWEHIHYFYWALAGVLALRGLAVRTSKTPDPVEEDIFYVLTTCIATLGFASAFDAMNLSTVLAVEGFCLFCIRMLTGRRLFSLLSLAIQTTAFLHMNTVSYHGFQIAPTTDWSLFIVGFWPVFFMFLPVVVVALWPTKGRPDTESKDNNLMTRILGTPWPSEKSFCHLRTIAASIMLFHLSYSTIRQETGFGLWVLFVPIITALAYFVRRIPALWTLAGSFLLWAHVCFPQQLDAIRANDPAWMFPAAYGMTALVLVFGILLDRLIRKSSAVKTPAMNHEQLSILSIVLAVPAFCDITKILPLLTGNPRIFPTAVGVSIGLLIIAVMFSTRTSAITGFLTGGWGAYLATQCMIDRGLYLPGAPLFWTLLGIGLLVLSERLLTIKRVRRFDESGLIQRSGPWVYVGIITALSVLFIHSAPWTEKRYETAGLTALAVSLITLGIVLMSAAYRRFGLGIFIIAVGRVFLIDLNHLDKWQRIAAFLVLGAALVVVSYFYNRFSARLRKWL